MIKNRRDYKFYLKADNIAINGTYKKYSMFRKIMAYFIPTSWKFEKLLRRAEFYCNCGNKFSKLFFGNLFKFQAYRYGIKCGYSIKINTFGPGLAITHIGTIVINGNVKIGSNARIQACVNIGSFSRFDDNWKDDCAPKIGDNVYIGPGAKIWGDIKIGDNVAIGANAVISKSIENHVTVAGANKIINEKGSIDMIKYGDQSKIPLDSYAFKIKMEEK